MNADLNPDELASGIARAWLPVSGARLYSATGSGLKEAAHIFYGYFSRGQQCIAEAALAA
jgi:hypothetical protein